MNDLKVTVGFSTTNKISSKIIRWLTRSPCSHAWVSFFDATLKMRMVMQAEWWGFELRPRKRWDKENIMVAEYEPVDVNLDPAVSFLADELGSRYDFGSAAWVGVKGWLRRLFRMRFLVRPNRTPHQMMCSEATARSLGHCDFPFQRQLDVESVSPGELMRICERSPRLSEKTAA